MKRILGIPGEPPEPPGTSGDPAGTPLGPPGDVPGNPGHAPGTRPGALGPLGAARGPPWTTKKAILTNSQRHKLAIAASESTCCNACP